MVLLLNYRPVLRQPTGIGVYANAVLPALQQLPHVLIPGGAQGSARARIRRLLWSQRQLPDLARQHGASLIFTPAPEGYLGRQTIAQVVMVHDLRPITHPERSLQSLYFRAWVPPLLGCCRHILTNSQHTAQEIQRCTGVADARISVIPLGYDAAVFQPAATAAPADRPYLLHVGQAYPHKNLARLIQAFAPLARRHRELRLVLAGKPHPRQTPPLQALVHELALGPQVEFRAYVPFADLPWLYRGALALVYPSLWEGFGLPLLEAMACGTPVVTSYGSGTQEVAGDAAYLVDPTSTEDLQQALQAIVERPALRSALARRGLARAAGFSWARTGEATRQQLAALLGACASSP